ncbi:MAG TPA: c-type cytochrome [Burkholderiales bacterium]|nr:c-type cytochrome [Burkholderiales bacterium]
MRTISAGVMLLLLWTVPGLAAAQADAAKGAAIANGVCAACHGADGNSVIPANPVLAGQHPEYIVKQLHNYKSGERKNPIMNGIAASLSEEDMRNVAAYFSQQKPRQGSAQDAKLATAGQKLYRGGNSDTGVVACAGCHSPDGAGIPIQYPRLKGQHSEYTVTQLKAFRSGERANDNASMMRNIASRMSDAEMAAVAEYASGLK